MKALFYILSVVAIVAAAIFSNVNKSNLEEQLEVRGDKIRENQRVAGNIETAETELKAEQKKLEDANAALAETQARIDSLSSDKRSLSREMGELEGELEQQQAKLDAAEEARKEIETALQSIGIEGPVTMASLQENIKALEDQQKSLEASIEELDTTIEGARSKVASNRDEIARLAKRKADRAARMRRNAMSAVVTGVDQDWGYVVIGAGSNSGFRPQTRLIVIRDGRRIAEVTPSSIEATQTIAEINYETLSPGARIQPGDRVILAKAVTN